MTTSSFVLWGFEGDFRGNESRIMARLPILSLMPDGRLAAARTADWTVSDDRTLTWLKSEAEASEVGTKLDLASPITATPNQVLAVAGPAFTRDLSAITDVAQLWASANWVSIQDGFQIRFVAPNEYEDLSARLADAAKRAFDGELRSQKATTVTNRAAAALRLLQGNGRAHVDQQVVRELTAARLGSDSDHYRTALELSALRLRESPERLELWVEDYFDFCLKQDVAPVAEQASRGRVVEDRLVTAPSLSKVLATLLASSDWKRALTELRDILPGLVEQAAIESDRSASDIVQDIVGRLSEPLRVDFKRAIELRREQETPGFKEGWIVAYPFLDLVEGDPQGRGFYETALLNLNRGVRYAYFQPDRRYFDWFRTHLSRDPRLSSSVQLDETTGDCQLFCIPIQEFLSAVEYAIWNPGARDMQGFVNDGDPISLEQQNDRWILKSEVVMKPIVDRQGLARLHNAARNAYERYFRERGQQPPIRLVKG